MPTPTAFHVAPTDTGCVIRVQGRGTMKESPTVKAVAMQALVGDERTIVAIDLSTCDYLDGAFLGALVELYNRFGRSKPTRFLVAASGEKRKALLYPAHRPDHSIDRFGASDAWGLGPDSGRTGRAARTEPAHDGMPSISFQIRQPDERHVRENCGPPGTGTGKTEMVMPGFVCSISR